MLQTNLQPLKGFRDFLPVEAKKRQWLKNKLSQICESWGYGPLETPTLEPLEIFKDQIGEDEKLFFKFKDLGERDVVLRYDQTVPTCRVVAEYFNQLPMPFKRYQVQTNFRAEKPQKGRYREFTQLDADIFGIKSVYADAEVIALSLFIYKELGFKRVRARISDRDQLKTLPYEAIVSIDKLSKIGEDGVLKEMENKGITLENAKEYLEVIKNPKPIESVTVILKYLKDMGFDSDWFGFDPTIARSFSYSNGPIWEVEIPGYVAGSVLGGERYDGIIKKLIGKEIPGTGFGLGFDRTLEACEQFGLIPQLETASKILVTIFSPDLFEESLKLVTMFRNIRTNGGIELYPDPNVKLDKQLKYANKKGIEYVLIMGPDEIRNKTVTVKNMKTKEQKIIKLTEVGNEMWEAGY